MANLEQWATVSAKSSWVDVPDDVDAPDDKGGDDSADQSLERCIFLDRRAGGDRRMRLQRLPRGAKCVRELSSITRRMRYTLCAQWYLEAAYLEAGNSPVR